MKKIFFIVLFGILGLSAISSVFAEASSRGKYGQDPIEILDHVVANANDDRAYSVQDTALDGIKAAPGRHKIYNTLQWIRTHISSYMQWAVYIGLTSAVILLIFNGLRMVTT
ncbi:MAG: hypothetical protein GXP45_07845 [bacterium]|nr:hypothetical protein [bacterium]